MMATSGDQAGAAQAVLGIWSASPLLIAVLWLSALAGWRQLGRLAAGPAYRQAFAMVNLALAACLVIAALASPAVGWLGPRASACAAALALVAYVGVTPPPSIWRNATLVNVLRAALLVLAVGAAATLPWPEAGPLLGALAVSYRHHRRISALALQCHEDLDALRRKVVALETRRPLAVAPAEAPADKLRKAG